jgi:ubiquinone/menaquinone biosynthesis C-methylase UbiE
VLEVGCGGGHLAIDGARRRPDLRITGLDLSAEQVARARRRGRDVAARVGFLEGSALDLPFGDGEFQAAWSVASIKHWPDQRRGLTEMVRVLRPGGALAVVEADRGCRLEDARAFVAHWRVPAPLRPLALMMFRTFVAGQGLDLDDARGHLAALPLDDVRAERMPGAPGLLLAGRKR